jgi:hypothetical protein
MLEVYGNARVFGNADVSGNAEVCDNADYIVFKNNWSSGRYFTYTYSNKMWRVGCFLGTSEELIQAEEKSENENKFYKYFVALVEKMEGV